MAKYIFFMPSLWGNFRGGRVRFAHIVRVHIQEGESLPIPYE